MDKKSKIRYFEDKKIDILIGISGGFITGMIFLIGDGISEVIKNSCYKEYYHRIKVGIPSVLGVLLVFRINRMKYK